MEKKFDGSWETALQLLKKGNEQSLNSVTSQGDISLELRKSAFTNGQKPYAVIVSCSDSRVIPESIFTASIGDLFVIRVVGNVVDSIVLARMEYAVAHLGVPLVVILGHTGCGAVNSAIDGNANGRVKDIIQKISMAIGEEKDDYLAANSNVKAGVNEFKQALGKDFPKVKVLGAIYLADTGKVEFL